MASLQTFEIGGRLSPLTVSVGSGGWMALRGIDDLDVRVGASRSDNGLVIHEVHLASPDPLGSLKPSAARDIPFAVLQSSVSAGPVHEALTLLWDDSDSADLRPGVLALAQLDDLDETRHPRSEIDLKIVVPPGREDRGDLFYGLVEMTYAKAAEMGIRGPAKAIAEASGVNVTTVHRWLKEARRRRADQERELRERNYRDALWHQAMERRVAQETGLTLDEYEARYEGTDDDPAGLWDQDFKERFLKILLDNPDGREAPTSGDASDAEGHDD